MTQRLSQPPPRNDPIVLDILQALGDLIAP
jgi:hypothetical protein